VRHHRTIRSVEEERTFYFKGTENGKPTGVCFINNKDLKSRITEIEGISVRVARVVIKTKKRYNMEIIQVYAPTTSHPEEEIEELYKEIQTILDISKSYYKFVIGNFNAKAGAKQSSDTKVGNFGFGKRNKREEKLVKFSEANRLFIFNTFFKKPTQRKWIWKGPNGTKNKIDNVLSNNRDILKDVSVPNCFKV